MGDGRGLYFHHPACVEHDPAACMRGHPDVPERLRAIEAELAAVGWLGWERRVAPAATEAQLELVHDARHVEHVRELCLTGGGALDVDTCATEASYEAALRAAGAAGALVRALLAGEARRGFCAVRPPGHHAERDRAMGFCLFNNVALAAELAIRELGARRVFVLDWDVHHGNGIAELFRERADVLYASIHQGYGMYPGTGARADTGSGAGVGCTLNLPVRAGADGALWRALLEQEVLPAAAAFEPDLVLIAAGYDAHREDPLGGCALESEDFAAMARAVSDFATAAEAPLGAVLEGGYEPRALARCVRATLAGLAEDQPKNSSAVS